MNVFVLFQNIFIILYSLGTSLNNLTTNFSTGTNHRTNLQCSSNSNHFDKSNNVKHI